MIEEAGNLLISYWKLMSPQVHRSTALLLFPQPCKTEAALHDERDRPSGGGGEGEASLPLSLPVHGAARLLCCFHCSASSAPLFLPLSLSNMDPVILDHNCRWLAKLGFHHFQLLLLPCFRAVWLCEQNTNTKCTTPS